LVHPLLLQKVQVRVHERVHERVHVPLQQVLSALVLLAR